jgi:hypothetical protein
MPEKERVDFSLPDAMDPDTLIPIPLHCISDIFAWMAYTRVIHPQSAFAKDIGTIRQAVWDVNKATNKPANKEVSKVVETSTDATVEKGYALIANKDNFLLTTIEGNEFCNYSVDFGDILVIEKIEENTELIGDAVVTLDFKRYSKRVNVRKSILEELVRMERFAVINDSESVRMLVAHCNV